MEVWNQLVFVLLTLGGLLALIWWLKQKGWATTALALKGQSQKQRQLRVIERTVVSAQHSLVLVEVSGSRMLVCFSPGSSSVTMLGKNHEDR